MVAGAGVVGASLALSMLKAGYKVYLLDLKAPQPWSADSLDLKVYAVNHKNVEFLRHLGAWDHIASRRVQKYNQLSLYADELPETFFASADIGLDYLGYMVENSALIAGIFQACEAYGDQFKLLLGTDGYQVQSASLETNGLYLVSERRYEIDPTKESWGVAGRSVDAGLTALHQHQIKLEASQGLTQAEFLPAHWNIKFTNGEQMQTSVILAADGANSFWRNQAKIPLDIHNYPTKCMLVEVTGDAQFLGKFQEHTWQKIDPAGPKAYLPMGANHGVLCWYDYPQVIDAFLRLSPEQQASKLLANFPGERVGTQLQVGKAGAFPLSRNRALRYWQGNVLLFGDAAHTVSPLAGQGLNIGLQDVQLFAELMGQNYEDFDRVGYAYAHERFVDNSLMQDFLTVLHHSYISKNPLAKLLTTNLNKIDQLPTVKKLALAYACGDRKLLRSYFNLKMELVNGVAGLVADLKSK